MEIEIITTKRKLTKSLLNQMCRASLAIMRNGESLGFLNNIIKNTPRLILIRHEKNYYIVSANYQKGYTSVYRTIGRAIETITFKSVHDCDAWWEAYQHMVHSAINQIYI